MKRFPLREFALLCAPIALIALALLVPRLLHPPKDPDAVIKLTVQEKPSGVGSSPQDNFLHFAWQADATGGPEYEYRIGVCERIVAITPDGEKMVYVQPSTAGLSNWNNLGGTGAIPGQSAMIMRNLQVNAQTIPITARRFEWRGEVVAVPRQSGSVTTSESAATLAKWAKIKGAAQVYKVIPIRFDVSKLAIATCRLEPIDAENAAAGFDTCITTEIAAQPRRICRRLVAFDGKTRRVVWQEKPATDFLQPGEEMYGLDGLAHHSLLFNLRKVPRAWGEISFLYDIVFLAHRPDVRVGNVDLKTLSALQRAGGARFSRRLMVRARGVLPSP